MVYEFIVTYPDKLKFLFQYSDLVFAEFAFRNFKEHVLTVSDIFINLIDSEPSLSPIYVGKL